MNINWPCYFFYHVYVVKKKGLESHLRFNTATLWCLTQDFQRQISWSLCLVIQDTM
jgi:hypothetical protein